MQREKFCCDRAVDGFAEWLARCLPTLPVHLVVKRSRFVPSRIDCQVIGIEAVLDRYTWRQSWTETKLEIKELRSGIARALFSRDQTKLLAACAAIVSWGGDRNANRGAMAFLRELPDLSAYLDGAAAVLKLETADTMQLGAVRRMNSMLTKIHAFLAEDGLPIYDSRVAAAIAALLECYRVEMRADWTEVPRLLLFPAPMSSRTVFELNAHALDHGLMAYRSDVWTEAKVRLGWLISLVLQKNLELFQHEGHIASRMHAFEAALFMIGYDVTCLSENYPENVKEASVAKPPPISKKGNRAADKWKRAGDAAILKAMTLSSTAKCFRYIIDEEEIVIEYQGPKSVTFLALPMEKIYELLFSLRDGPIELGASQHKGQGDDRTIGNWLLVEGLAASRQFASRVAGVLCQEGMLAVLRGHPLRFKEALSTDH